MALLSSTLLGFVEIKSFPLLYCKAHYLIDCATDAVRQLSSVFITCMLVFASAQNLRFPFHLHLPAWRTHLKVQLEASTRV